MKAISDLEFMTLVEKEILAGEPSVDPVLTRYPGSPEAIAAMHVADILYVDGDPTKGYNPRINNRNFIG